MGVLVGLIPHPKLTPGASADAAQDVCLYPMKEGLNGGEGDMMPHTKPILRSCQDLHWLAVRIRLRDRDVGKRLWVGGRARIEVSGLFSLISKRHKAQDQRDASKRCFARGERRRR